MMGESLATRIDIGEQGGIAWCLEKLAEAMVLQATAFPVSHRRQHSNGRAGFRRCAALRAPLQSIIDPD
jgi:hypothetical protein